MKKILFTLSLLALISTPAAFAGPEEHMKMPVYTGSAEFEKLKTLVGRWEGKSNEAADEAIVVEYKLTGNGSTLVETIGPGTQMEMTTVYYDNDKKLGMTHYCALGNRPEMELAESTDQSITLALVADGDVQPTDAHMHSLHIILEDADHITQEWAYYEGGEQKSSTIFTLTRAKPL